MFSALSDVCDFYLCTNFKRQWMGPHGSNRPIPQNVKFVSSYESGKYDVALLHVDQQSISPFHQKRKIYDGFNTQIMDIPKIVINHGTPVYPEFFSGLQLDDHEIERKCAATMKEVIGPNIMVVNSYTSASENEWGFGIPIVHGIDIADWRDLPKEPRLFTAISSGGLDTYYNRALLFETEELLLRKYGYILWHAKKNVKTENSFDNYRNYLGSSLLYLDTSFRTPMNRARTEAFLSGCCVIQVEGAHDLNLWAEDKVNIILVKAEAEVICEKVVYFLEKGYHEAIEIGKMAKSMAHKMFNPIRYRKDWLNVINKALE